ncbi:MAG TPA: hypothetical protein VGM50_20005 [Gemmatimonadaceae bacterium]|jgi:hypothetical protein
MATAAAHPASQKVSPVVTYAAHAQQLLAELDRHTVATMDLIGGETPTEFFMALHERDRLFGELNAVVEAMTRERAITARDREVQVAVVQEVVKSATVALGSHKQLVERMQQERDRLADAVQRAKKPDTVAHQYAGYGARRSGGLSITG